KRRSLSAVEAPPSSYHRLQGCQPVGLSRRFVDPDSADARKAHGEARFVTAALVDRIERDFEDESFLDLADRAEALDRVPPNPPVEPFQFLIGEAEIGLADRKQLSRLGPAAESVIAVIARSLPRPALGVHEDAIGGQRIALPFVPEARPAAADISAVAP